MAVRFARRVRPLLVIAALSSAAVVGLPTLASAAPTTPQTKSPQSGTQSTHHGKPTIASVQKQLGELAVTNSQVVEQFDHARVAVAARTKAAGAAKSAATKAAATYNAASALFTQVVQAQYESGGVSGASGAILSSDSGGNYLDRISTLSLVSTHEADVVKDVQRARSATVAASAKAKRLLEQATAERDALVSKKTRVEKQIKTYKTLLAKLNSAQQAAYQRALNPSVTPSDIHNIQVTATTAGARKAIQFALDQVGKPYVFGAAGPSSYDCSGLTMSAWAQGGVSLPHSAADQYNYGHHVSRDQLQPGDLIFFYQPIGHVTIYIGDGMMVSAPTAGENVSVVPLDAYNSDYTGATRLD